MEKTISQIICQDYRGFSQIMLSTEGETEIKRAGKGQSFSAESQCIFTLNETCSSVLTLPIVVSLPGLNCSKGSVFFSLVSFSKSVQTVQCLDTLWFEPIQPVIHLQINPTEASAPIHSLKINEPHQCLRKYPVTAEPPRWQ